LSDPGGLDEDELRDDDQDGKLEGQKPIREGTWQAWSTRWHCYASLHGFFWYVGIYEIMGWENGLATSMTRSSEITSTMATGVFKQETESTSFANN
jgi:hypothetical protein